MTKSNNRSKRWFRIHLSAIAATGLASVANSYGTSLLFDNSTTPFSNGFANASYTTGIADTYEGAAYTLPAGTADITGFDFFPLNESGNTYPDVQVTIYLWGSVNTTGTVNSATPAFSNLLAQVSGVGSFASPGLPPAHIGEFGGTTPSTTGDFTLNSPLAIPNNVVGVTINYQGSTDGTTFNSAQGLTSIIPYTDLPTAGSAVFNGFYRNGDSGGTTEVNGNFISGLHVFQNANGSAALPNQSGPMFRLYGDVASTTPDLWLNSGGGTWSDGTQWSNTTPPGGGTDAIFNLSSASPYIVEVGAAEVANDIFVQKDNVIFDLDALASQLSVNKVLAVGQSPNGNASSGSLVLQNSGGEQTNIVEPGSIVVGSNGGTGTLKVTNGIYLFSNSDTAIGAGSSLSVGAFAKFGTGTLTIAGVTNAWTGQLDIGNTSLNIRNGSIGTVINQLKTGLGNGSWTGKGIVSSNAAADPTHLTAVGAILNNDGNGNQIYGSGTTLGLFDGDNPATSSVLVRYTYFGDANLDGQVDGSDYSRIDNGFLLHLTGWYNGDFNYDGVVNGSDYTLIDNAYNMQGPNLVTTPGATPSVLGEGVSASAVEAFNERMDTATQNAPGSVVDIDPTVTLTAQIAGSSSVPEPASLGVLAIAGASMLSRRSRRMPSRPR